MRQGSARFLRENAFLAAAVILPLIVVVLFVLASIVPRWVVTPLLAALATSGAMTAQMGAIFHRFRRSTPLFMVLVFGSFF